MKNTNLDCIGMVFELTVLAYAIFNKWVFVAGFALFGYFVMSYQYFKDKRREDAQALKKREDAWKERQERGVSNAGD